MLPLGAYNPSLIKFQQRLLMAYRHHDRKEGAWRTNLGIAELGTDLKPISTKPIHAPEELKDNSFEDARLWIHQGTLWASFSISQWPTQEHRSIVAYGKLVEGKDSWSITSNHIPDYGQNDFGACEKNWIFLSRGEKLFALYLTYEEQVWIELDGARVEEVQKAKALPWPYATVHGGSICEGTNGNLLHVFNSHTSHRDRSLDRYLVGVAELSGQPPFDMLAISKRPVLVGTEGVCLDKNPHYKPNVVFVCGVVKTGNDQWLVSFGQNDHKCFLVKLGVADLKL